MTARKWLGACVLAVGLLSLAGRAPAEGEKPGKAVLKALIVDGRNNHDWRATTPLLKKYLEETGLFTVDVATAGADVSTFKPKFSDYQVVVSNYNNNDGKEWPKETRDAF